MSTTSDSDAHTLVGDKPRAGAKKQRRSPRQSTSPKEEKLFEKLGKALTDEMANNASHLNSHALFERLAPPQLPTIQTTTTTTAIEIVTTTVERKESIPKNYRKPRPISTEVRTIRAKYKTGGNVFTLDDFSAIAALERLVDRFGKVSHMGILDRSYSFFVTKHRDAALYFKVSDKVAVVGGDPLCESRKFDNILTEFAEYRKQFGWGIAFLGATSEFAEYAQSKKWVTMQFGVERVLNPMTNPLLLETGGGKRTISQNKKLVREGITLGIYTPTHGVDAVLQEQLVEIYETWRSHRNEKPAAQAYITIYDPFAMPELMTYIYAKDAEGKPCGLAALRKIVNGYHIDPCIALPGSARGISELLIFAAMSLLHKAGVSYLSLGFEPSGELGKITGLSKPLQSLTRSVHRRTYRGLPIGGKRDFHDKFRPDEDQQADLYLVFPGRGVPGVKHMKAMVHTANIKISKLVAEDAKKSLPWFRDDQALQRAEKETAKSASESE